MRGEQNVSMERWPWGGLPLYTNMNGKERVPPVRWEVTSVDRTSAKVSLACSWVKQEGDDPAEFASQKHL